MSFRDFSIVYAFIVINSVAMIAARLSGPLDFLQFSHVRKFNFSEVHLLLRLTAAASVALRNEST